MLCFVLSMTCSASCFEGVLIAEFLAVSKYRIYSKSETCLRYVELGTNVISESFCSCSSVLSHLQNVDAKMETGSGAASLYGRNYTMACSGICKHLLFLNLLTNSF